MRRVMPFLCIVFFASIGIAANAWSDVPRPEHPTPQMFREAWTSLNGEWEFAETDDSSEDRFLKDEPYPDKIVVPFCRESKLSGLERKGFVKNVWYRRHFELRQGDNWPRTLLHVGACDWHTRVWVNGVQIGDHTGGSVAFALEATRALKMGENTVVIHAFDDTRSGTQPTGKQAHEPNSNGCVYTRTTGIWQTVWLEGVPTSFIREYYVMPDIEHGRANIRVSIDGACEGLSVGAKALIEGREVAMAQTVAGNKREVFLTLDLPDKHLWSPSDPFLYDLALTLDDGKGHVDNVKGYFGLREVSIQNAAFLINGKAIFQRLVLDQGFYPDGIWTAPSEEALKHDIELSMAAGFNGARLHQKVFEPRFLYWADKMGYLVWGEYPSWGANVTLAGVDVPILAEWIEIVRRDRNHPAIIGWCPYNETDAAWGTLQNATVYATREADPTRPVLDTSGYVHSLPDPQVLDAHDYNQDPASFRSTWEMRLSDAPLPSRYSGGNGRIDVPFFVSEYGGIGWSIHANGWGYGNAPKDLDAFYARFKGLADAQLDNRRLCGFCYTQLTDIEQEQNGVYTYERTPKFDTEKLKAALSREAAYEKNPPTEARAAQSSEWQVVVGAFPDGDLCRPWRYAFDQPAENWATPAFDDGSWQVGAPGFGKKPGWEKKTRTAWATKDIWLRQSFECSAAESFKHLELIIHYDNGTEVYLNGKPLWAGKGWNDNYSAYDVTEAARGALQSGKNVIAVHCHQDEGGQFIDLALLGSAL